MAGPTSPDAWMWETGKVLRCPFGEASFHAGIPAILKRLRMKDSPYAQMCQSAHDSPDGPTTWYCMAQKIPLKIPSGMAKKMLAHLKTRNVGKLQGLLQQDGVLQPADESAQAPLRFDRDSYADVYNKYCLVWRVGQDSRLNSICFLHKKNNNILSLGARVTV